MTVILEPAPAGERAQHPRMRSRVLGLDPPQRPQCVRLHPRR